METSRIGVIGAKGRVGSQLVRMGCTPLECNLMDLSSIKNILKKINPLVVINCAGFTNVDLCETEVVRAYQINTFAPKSILQYWKGRFIHLSTDYIFRGDKIGGYNETDIPEPQGTYATSKYFGEVAVRYHSDLCIVRTTVLYDGLHEKPNFVKTVYHKLKNKELVQVPQMYGSPTFIPHLVETLIQVAKTKCQGVLNIAGNDLVTRFELAKQIAKTFDFDPSLVVMGSIYGDAKRGERYGLKLDKASKLGYKIYTLEEGLNEFKCQMLG